MARLTDYFKCKLASSISRRIIRIDRAFELEYVAEVIQLRPTSVVVNVTRRTFSPAGPIYAGEDIYLGDMLIPLSPISGLEDFWRSLISVADPDMLDHVILPAPSGWTTPDLELLEE